MRITNYIAALLVVGAAFTSCGDDEPKDVNVQFQMNIGEEALVHEKTYSVNNTDVQFTNVAFYLGDMTFETSDGFTFNSTDRYYLIKPGSYNFNFTVPDDNKDDEILLSKISFFVGVDPETNSESEMDFLERPEGDVLGQQNPTMHWGWAGGYRFISIDAEADLDGDGEFEQPLTYHIGFDDFLKNISLSPNTPIANGKNEFQVIFDMAAFLNGLDFSTENFTKVQPDNRSLADKLYANYDAAFSFVK